MRTNKTKYKYNTIEFDIQPESNKRASIHPKCTFQIITKYSSSTDGFKPISVIQHSILVIVQLLWTRRGMPICEFCPTCFLFIRLKKCESFFGACLHQHKDLFVPNRTYFLFFTLEVSGLILIYNGSNLVFIQVFIQNIGLLFS